MATMKPLIVDAVKKHTATVIMAHGLGDSGAGWVSLAENWRRRGKFEDVKFVFPNAPSIPITINGGYVMPGWYDITSFSALNRSSDEAGIMKSRTTITKLIQDEIDAGIPSQRIVLGGFSQGGAMSIITGISTPIKLGGVFGLSCYLVMSEKTDVLAKEAKEANLNTPFFMGHGDADEVVKHEYGERTAAVLRGQLGHNVVFKTYPGLPHSAAVEEIDDLENFIETCLKANEDAVKSNS